jgi:hypothetical protein
MCVSIYLYIRELSAYGCDSWEQGMLAIFSKDSPRTKDGAEDRIMGLDYHKTSEQQRERNKPTGREK